VASSHPLLVCYVADRKGRQSGIVHGTGGFLTFAAAVHSDVLVEEGGDVVWCAAEVSWIAGQSHAIYGPLACGGTSVAYEGMLDAPTHRRTWEMVERYGVATLVTTPSVVRNVARWEDGRPKPHEAASLRLVITAGEPIEQPLREWISEIAPEGATLADGWGQTELGGIVAPTAARSRVYGLPDPGLDVVSPDGLTCGTGVRGELVLRHPWPGTFMGVHGDDGTLAAHYWERYPGLYATGDWAWLERDGSLTLLGRMDPLISVSGQLVSLTEIGEALLEHPFVAAAHVVDYSSRKVGHALAACVLVQDGVEGDAELARSLRTHAHERLGGLAQPYTVAFVESLPGDQPPEKLREGLRAICVGQSAEVTWISTAQLEAALAIVEREASPGRRRAPD
jgi:acetyl-CoA synthetase